MSGQAFEDLAVAVAAAKNYAEALDPGSRKLVHGLLDNLLDLRRQLLSEETWKELLREVTTAVLSGAAATDALLDKSNELKPLVEKFRQTDAELEALLNAARQILPLVEHAVEQKRRELDIREKEAEVERLREVNEKTRAEMEKALHAYRMEALKKVGPHTIFVIVTALAIILLTWAGVRWEPILSIWGGSWDDSATVPSPTSAPQEGAAELEELPAGDQISPEVQVPRE